EGRRAFRRVEDAEAPARPGSRVDEATTRPERAGDDVDGTGERPADARHACRRAEVLASDDSHEALRGQPVEASSPRVLALGRQPSVVDGAGDPGELRPGTDAGARRAERTGHDAVLVAHGSPRCQGG